MGERAVCDTCAALDRDGAYPGYCQNCHALWRYVVDEPTVCALCAGEWAVLAYLAQPEPAPTHLLRKVAHRFPEFEWLCFLPPDERRWYLERGPEDYICGSFFQHLPDWAWAALKA